jgi:hypothetical protein
MYCGDRGSASAPRSSASPMSRVSPAGYGRRELGGRIRGSHRQGGGDRVRLSRQLERDAVEAGLVDPWKHCLRGQFSSSVPCGVGLTWKSERRLSPLVSFSIKRRCPGHVRLAFNSDTIADPFAWGLRTSNGSLPATCSEGGLSLSGPLT